MGAALAIPVATGLPAAWGVGAAALGVGAVALAGVGAAAAVAGLANELGKVFKDPPSRPVHFLRPLDFWHPPAPKPIPDDDDPSGPGPARDPPKESPAVLIVLIERARKKLGIDAINCYNFAVTGQSGVGKSSFINGIRFIPDNHPDAAGIGQTECTQVVKRYPHPSAPHVVLWDFPGAGTKSHPAATYFSDKMLYAFDAILILTSNRFMEVDLEIAKAALQHGKPCAFVRTKCDIAVSSVVMNATTKIQAIEASMRLRKDVENSFHNCLKQVGLADSASRIPLFFISNKAFTKKNAYWVVDQDNDPPKWDKSLPSMDESNLLKFLMDSAKPRAKNPM